MARRAIAVIVVLSLVLPGSAFAQDGGCQKQTGAVCGVGDIGRVAALGGEANLSHGGDFTPIKTQAQLRPGDRVLAGANAARLELGGACSTSLAPGSLATITRRGNLICVSAFEKTPKGVLELGDNDDRPGFLESNKIGIVAGISGLAVIGAAIGIAASSKSNSPAPTFVSAQ